MRVNKTKATKHLQLQKYVNKGSYKGTNFRNNVCEGKNLTLPHSVFAS